MGFPGDGTLSPLHTLGKPRAGALEQRELDTSALLNLRENLWLRVQVEPENIYPADRETQVSIEICDLHLLNACHCTRCVAFA